MKIILDTNILIYIIKFKVNISQLKEHQLYTLEPVKKELKSLDSLEAKIALELTKDLKVLKSKGNVDNLLIKYGKKGYIIATQDKELRKRLKEENCKTIYLRQKKYFEGLK